GAGDGTTTFNIPNLVARFPVNIGGPYSLGDTGGANSVTLTQSQMPSHSHTTPNHNHQMPNHVHTMNHSHTVNHRGSETVSAHAHTYNGARLASAAPTDPKVDGTHTTSGPSATNTGNPTTNPNTGNASPTTNSTGGGQPHENRPPFLALQFIIYLGV